jgi:hypothetical protein
MQRISCTRSPISKADLAERGHRASSPGPRRLHLGQRGPQAARRDERAVVRQRRLWPQELADAATRQMNELPFYNSFFQTANRRRSSWPRSWRRSRPQQFQHVFFPARAAKAMTRSSAWCAATGTCSGSPSARSSSAAGTATTAARWRGLARRHEDMHAQGGCRSRTSRTSTSRTGSEAGSQGEPRREFGMRAARVAGTEDPRRSVPSGSRPSSASRCRARAA